MMVSDTHFFERNNRKIPFHFPLIYNDNHYHLKIRRRSPWINGTVVYEKAQGYTCNLWYSCNINIKIMITQCLLHGFLSKWTDKGKCHTLNEQTGKQALRSQEWMQTALFQLMEKKPYSMISVTEITERAGLARQTFYRNYQDKDEILLQYLHGLWKGMRDNAAKPAAFDEEMFVTLFRHWKANAPSSLLHNIELKDRKIRQLMYKSICDFFDELSEQMIQENTKVTEGAYRFYAHKSLSSVVHMMLMEWTLNQFHLAPEEIGRMVSHFTDSIRKHL